MKKKLYKLLVIAVFASILLLTFQNAEKTVALSESLRLWFENMGIHNSFHTFRSNAHLVEYFILGIILTLYGQEAKWKWWKTIIIGCFLGLFDEGIRTFIPTREFDIVDLLKDCIGILTGFSVVRLFLVFGKNNNSH